MVGFLKAVHEARHGQGDERRRTTGCVFDRLNVPPLRDSAIRHSPASQPTSQPANQPTSQRRVAHVPSLAERPCLKIRRWKAGLARGRVSPTRQAGLGKSGSITCQAVALTFAGRLVVEYADVAAHFVAVLVPY